ncbi:metallophosphoesterase [Lactiplantibacillus mudanjiangensis]|uniref:Phosphoesterase [Lactobacillus sakei subsp. sakei 23K] n=1 Tax=Lactiplantibacillus mudanjiangensis TaxID=1296538 RepID=A0A660ECY8_9LACO|nr:metallophosphoesterase [Lactiplantibacillus mudanjiangensis]VDG20488.1 Putative phosphoesterase [Lactobacillus sakei subsp. sakei 23K] [Lactiplantibacillus mudanjiangensis]VDG24286.1 Putative phosphoesterase [Lactobacillus sakei subsp. sakei 23K] [Lactiplantibacillus mudanjiangensis]VDG30451.1 Putative phosphoesterase [Lactobacillus sakei subsp. sakei 23K] [Lactiplantibacillus mudanjiangensis]
MQYFIADLHFYHEAIIDFSQRPFKDVADMNAQLIKNWNSVVQSPKDEVYVLGDFLYHGTGAQANALLRQLRGKKYLIKGNHEDYLADPDFDQSLFDWIKGYETFKYHRRQFVLFHYPILEWDGYFKQSILLYGHVHNTRVDFFNGTLGVNAVNVGADLINYRPISIEQVIDLVNEREMTW